MHVSSKIGSSRMEYLEKQSGMKELGTEVSHRTDRGGKTSDGKV